MTVEPKNAGTLFASGPSGIGSVGTAFAVAGKTAEAAATTSSARNRLIEPANNKQRILSETSLVGSLIEEKRKGG
jgi:hypothetical protein